MAELIGQTELFPIAREEEIKQTKSLLGRYRWMKSVVSELEKRESLDPVQKSAYNAYLKAIEDIESSVRLILDDEVRRIIETRYIKGERHKITVIRFSNMHPSTVDRKLNEGIEAVANSLLLLRS